MKHDDKWMVHAEMVRAVRELQQALEDGSELTESLKVRTDNAIYNFLAACPAKVREEVREG